MATVPIREPLEINAGDSIHFTKTLNDYPATTWTLAYRLLAMQGQSAVDIAATASGTRFDIAVTSAVTALWVPGEYWLLGFVSAGTERFQIYNGRLSVKPDPATVSNYDGRTYMQRVLALLQKTFEEGVIREVIRYSYGGVTTEVQSMKDVIEAMNVVKAVVAQEERLATGKQGRVLTRFRSPM